MMRRLKRTLPLFAAASLLGLVIGCSDPQAQESSAGATTMNQNAAISSPVMKPGEAALPDMTPGACNFPQEWIGKKVDRDAVKAAAKSFRILHPDDPATMDYSPERLNVIIDDHDIVTEVKCG